MAIKTHKSQDSNKQADEVETALIKKGGDVSKLDTQYGGFDSNRNKDRESNKPNFDDNISPF